jgi:two-component system sensor histidine kinase DesK
MSGEPATNTTSHSPLRRPSRHRPRVRRRLEVPDSRGTQRWAPRVAHLTTISVLCGYGFVAVVNFLREHVSWLEALGFASLFSLVFALQVIHSFGEPLHWSRRRKILSLTVQALATYVPFLWIGTVWGGMAGFLAGSALLVVGGRPRWVLYAVIGFSVLAPAMLLGMTAPDTAYFVISTLLTGLVVYAISSLSALVLEVNNTRAEIARMAVFQERLRVSRDLHDLIGYSLSSITLQSELTYRLLPENPNRARQHVAELLDVSRQALSDVRAVASGYREMSLAVELESARSVLAAAEVAAEVHISCGPLPQPADMVMASVLREAITNVLRHSRAKQCVIQATRSGNTVRLHVANDGVAAGPKASQGHDGSGLGNLTARLEAIDGRLSTEIRDGRWFHLTAEAPVSPAATGHGAGAAPA